MSMDFARRQGLQILPMSSHSVKAANGAKIALAGTVDAPFGVMGTSKIELLRFHVMATGVTDVILGHRFLQLTKAFTRFRAQIVHTARRARGSRLRHVRFLQGSVQQVRGYLDHGRIDAVADTGSDVTLLSSLYARERGLKVSYNRQDQVELEFADGSTMWTQGCVRDVDWKYDSVTPSTHRLDAYILNSLPCGVLIGYDVLYATDAFAMHADALFSQYDRDSDIEDTLDHNLNYIQRRSQAGGPETALEAWQAAKTLALSRYGVAQ
ncbi:hypothetical protein B0A48_08280 [Cryoendolithus antarcticus]|uniref:Peptidase A2 domain-containing protein n=1 Tax=Cryoendolithus antarcticus TaxID=1507870 RepID=A0A1V8T503_9PEZI|nr:hypothetical protein B0A48_08280 [Cryoendolithus antarcticus]